ncbi:MAG: hypothetical protein ACXWB9_08275 [Flavisolibacter sp.]
MKDKNAIVEKGVVITMFVLVLVVFSFAQRDTQKLVALYSGTSTARMTDVADQLMARSANSLSAPQQ